MDINVPTFFVSSIAGLASFISPCVLPLILPFISLITGISVDNLKTSKELSKNVVIKTLFFILGFSFIFIVLGMSASQLGSLFGKYKTILRYIGGCIVVLFGLNICTILKIKFLNKQFSYAGKSSTGALTNTGIFFMGIAFALGWTPCVGPILTSILIVASTQGTVLSGFWLLVFFSLGFGIPFILTALFVNRFLSAFKIIKKYYRTIEIISGLLLIFTGILLITNVFLKITSFMLS
ncbi:MAG: cytochrome c biogenesis protein CcdA [Endomicrobium sp.]|jgi:cytochrome c-type biogenesis protein|nr:cytochrome c biogenesis protein CcdA [Endomicrobium sp.]